MRLVSLARFRYGLLWSGSFPKIDWLRWIQACSLVALVLTAYAVVDANSRYDLASAKQAAAERKAVEAEQALAKCKNGGFAARTEGGAVYCEKALWVAL